MRPRVLSALVVAPAALACVVAGGIYLAALVGAIGILAMLEFSRLARASGFAPQTALGVAGVVALAVAGHLGANEWMGAIVALLVVGSMITQTIGAGRENAVANPAVTVLGAAYIGWALATFLLLRRLGGEGAGLGHAVCALVTVWATDTGAFFFGSAFGRHRLLPAVSPKKSVEGAVFGLVAGVAAGVGSRLLGAELGWWPAMAAPSATAISLAASVAGQAGDLAESAMKRNANVKDSGVFMPGHGGVLDRIDSLLFAIPVVYYCLRLFVR